MDTEEKIEINADHLNTLRERYNYKDMSDDQIIKALIFYEDRFAGGNVRLLDHLAFPSFQCILDHIKHK